MHAGHDMHTAVEHGDAHDTASDDAGDDMNHHAKEHDSPQCIVAAQNTPT